MSLTTEHGLEVDVAEKGIRDRSDSGPSELILLHNESQLLITSVNRPLSSPSSTCNAWTAVIETYDAITVRLKLKMNT